MNDTIFHLLIASLIFWGSFLLCDLSLKRTSPGVYVYAIIGGVYILDCLLYYFTSFKDLPYIWYIFSLFPIFILPLLYKNQLTIIIFTYASSMLFSFMVHLCVKMSEYIIYLNYPDIYVGLDMSLILMIALALYLVCIPAFLRFAFEKIAKRATSRAMWMTWLFPIIGFIVLLYNDYRNAIYTTTIVRYMGSLIIMMFFVYIIFYMMLTSDVKVIQTAGPRVHLDRPVHRQTNTNTNENLVLFEKQYFESIINSYNDTLDRAYVMEKGLHTIQRLLNERNPEEAQRCINQLQYEIKDIQLLKVTNNTVVDTLLSYYHYLYMKDELNLQFAIQLPQQGMRDLDLCILFGSLLQNAYDLLYECQTDHGDVLLECIMQGNKMSVTCASTYIGDHDSIRRASNNFNLRSVRELCNTYRGEIHMECPKDVFYVYADIVL